MAASEQGLVEGFIFIENEEPFDCGLCFKWLHFQMCDLRIHSLFIYTLFAAGHISLSI